MAQLPYIQTQDRVLSQIQTQWRALLNPILADPLAQAVAITAPLKVGVNNINHLLQQNQQGWIITDIDGAATIYRSAPFNDKTLVLTSNAAVTVNLLVY